MKKIFLLLTILITSICFSNEIKDFKVEKIGYVYFFEKSVPDNISVENGKLSISNLRYKDGTSSLYWQFNSNSKLIFNNDIVNNENSLPFTFMVWIYQEKAHPNKNLKFEFYNDNKVEKTFKLNLNFKGCHGLAIPYKDMLGNNYTKLNKLIITAPNLEDAIYIDQLVFSAPMDKRYPAADYGTPFINIEQRTEANKHWNAILMYQEYYNEYLKNRKSIKIPNNDSFLKSIDTITKHLEYINEVDRNKIYLDEDIKKVIKDFDNLNIKEINGILVGDKLAFPNSLAQFKNSKYISEETKNILIKSIDFRTFGKILKNISLILNSKDLSNDNKIELENRFILATKFLIDQGYNYGSGFQTVDHMGYQNRELFQALFNARNLINENNLSNEVQKLMFWYSLASRIVLELNEHSDIDVLNTQLQYMLQSIILMENNELKYDLLSKFTDFINYNLTNSNGISGGFKIDNATFHHRQNYTAYGIDALNGLTPVIYALSKTDFAISDKSYQKVKDVASTLDFYTKNDIIPISLSGRHPTYAYKVRPNIYKYIAMSDPNGLNKEFAGIYSRVANLDSFEGIKKSKEQLGTKVINYASMLVNRIDDNTNDDTNYLLIFRGFSRYFASHETYWGNNWYGRYNLYGRMEIMPKNFEDRTFRVNGFDWNHFDGTTTEYLPYEQLQARLDYGEEELLSDETYVGGNSLDNYSMFSMKVHGHPKYNQENNRANKSYFVFNGNIVALGSNIQSKSENETHTTLFQTFMKENDSINVNGKNINTQINIDINKSNSFKIPANATYFIKDKNIVFNIKEQTSPDSRTKKYNIGKYATAYINHGKNVKNGTYEYQVVIGNKKKENYKLIKKNNFVHAIKFKNIYYYSFFEKYNLKTSPLLSSDTSSMYILKDLGNKLEISVLNPDLAFYTGIDKEQYVNGKQIEINIYTRAWENNFSQEMPSIFTIKGKWKSKDKDVKLEYIGNNTKISILTKDGIPKKLYLEK